MLHNQVFCNCSSALQCKPRTGTDEWRQKAEELYEDGSFGANPWLHFSVDKRVFMVLKYTETGNVLETIRKFQRQFPNQTTPCRQTIMDNYNKYAQYGLSLNRNVGHSGFPVRKLPLKPFDWFQNITGTVYLKTIYTRSSTENCGLGYEPAIHIFPHALFVHLTNV